MGLNLGRSWIGVVLLLVSAEAFGVRCHTKYPIVFGHGLYASRKLISLKQIARAVESAGCRVYLTEVSAANSIAVRGEQLAPQIDDILRETGAEKVNFVGHSMGGLDGRYLVSSLGYGDRVASVTTVGSPHYGTSAAEQFLALMPDKAMDFFGWLSTLTSDSTDPDTVDFTEAVQNLTRAYMRQEFNPHNPDDPRVYYQSWAGRASPISWQSDHLRLVMRPLYRHMSSVEGANDGMVPTANAKWGRYRGVLPADHFSQIGAALPKGFRPFDFRGFFTQVATELGQLGY